jgi:hypothetical protein
LKNLFALRGTTHKGKSHTIRTVVELLTQNHPDAAIEHNYTTKSEIRIVLTINGLKIGIDSQSGRLATGSLALFVNGGCDVIVCATRTSRAAVNAVNELQGFDIHWLEQPEKSEPYEQILRSLTMASQIVAQVETVIQSAKPALARTMSANA